MMQDFVSHSFNLGQSVVLSIIWNTSSDVFLLYKKSLNQSKLETMLKNRMKLNL